jgi:hypothetical protein
VNVDKSARSMADVELVFLSREEPGLGFFLAFPWFLSGVYDLELV